MTTRAALIASGLLISVLLAISYDQISDHLQPRTDWLQQHFQMADAIGYVVALSIIALVSWLTNREINQTLARMHTSEAALAKERDSLEVKVAERTRELQETQLLRTVELQHFADFGRLSANLLHEIANPLTAASLNLEQLGNQESELVLQARHSLQQLERYLEAIRQQIKLQGNETLFSVQEELDRIARVMQPLMRHNRISFAVSLRRDYRLYGDPVKFNQLVANLLANAIDAYSHHDGNNDSRRIAVTVTKRRQWLVLTVRDWGKGIAPAELPRLFEPFYTTKFANERSLGIGLTMIKRIAEKDYAGGISAQSSLGEGTCFTVKLRLPVNHTQASMLSRNQPRRSRSVTR